MTPQKSTSKYAFCNSLLPLPVSAGASQQDLQGSRTPPSNEENRRAISVLRIISTQLVCVQKVPIEYQENVFIRAEGTALVPGHRAGDEVHENPTVRGGCELIVTAAAMPSVTDYFCTPSLGGWLYHTTRAQ